MRTTLPNGDTQCNPRIAYNKGYEQGKIDTIEDVIKTLAQSEDTMLSDKQYYALMKLKGEEE